MPDKKYLIEIPGREGISRLNETDWASNKDAILAKYPNANVVSIDMYDPEDIQDNDAYLVSIEGRDSVSQFNGADWAKHKDAILTKYPKAQISRMRGVDYYYDQANELSAALEEKDAEIEAWQNSIAEKTGGSDWSAVMLQQNGLKPIGTGLDAERDEAIAAYVAEGEQLQEKKRQLQEAYDNNPRVKAAREEWEKNAETEFARYQKEYLGNMRNQITSDMESDVDMAAAASGKLAMPDDGFSSDINTHNYFEKQKLEQYQAALQFLDKAEEARTGQLKGFWKGVGDVAEHTFEQLESQKDIATYADIFTIMQKLEKKYGTLKDVSEEQIERSLEPSEKALLKAYFEYSDAISQNSGDKKYKAGQQAGQWAQFAIEFALGGKVADSAARGLSKGVVAGLERWAAKALAGTFKGATRNLVAKAGTMATRGLTNVAIATALRPSTYTHMAQAATSVDKRGHLNPAKEMSLSFLDDAIETVSEKSGELIGKVLGVPLKPVKKWTSKAWDAAFGGTKFAEWGKLLTNGPVADYIKQAGFNGYPIEILEEYVGNAMRLPMDSEALKNMHQDGNGYAMLVGFLPATLIGGGISAAQFGFAQKRATNSAAALQEMLINKGFGQGRSQFLSDYKRDMSPLELGKDMYELKQELEAKGASQDELQMVSDYATAVAEYQTLRGGMKEMQAKEREQVMTELEGQYKQFYKVDDNGNKSVNIATDYYGRQYFLISPSEMGEIAAIDKETGVQVFLNESDIKMQEVVPMENFLDGVLQGRRELAQMERMTNERDEQIAKLSELLPKTLNLGTKGTPNEVVVKGKTNKGVSVVDAAGNEILLSWDQVGRTMGMPIEVLTDAQIAEAEAAAYGLGRAEKKAQGATTQEEADSVQRQGENIAEEVKNATPKPEDLYRDQETGEIDEDAFWENDPEGWADYNDRQMQDGGLDSMEQIDNGLALLNQQMAQLNKMATDSPNARKTINTQKAQLQEKIDRLTALQQKYVDAAAVAEQQREKTEEERAELTLVLRERVAEWRKRLGLSDEQLIVFESKEDIQNSPYLSEKDKANVLAVINKGKTEGWYNTASTRAFVFLPDINSAEELDKTIAHEVVTHYGLHNLMGEQAYNELMDKVWNMMSDAAKGTYYNYPGVSNEKDADKRRRMAAEEFVARVAERVSLGDATAEHKSLWQRIVDFFRNLFKGSKFTEKDIAGIVRKNYQQLTEQAKQAEVENFKAEAREQTENNLETAHTESQERAAIDTNSNQQAEGNTLFKSTNGPLVGMHNISEDKLRKVLKQGGLANPSTAVVNIAEYLLDGYGDISLIMPSSLVDANTGDNIGTYTGDAWTPTYPPISRKVDNKGWKVIKELIRSVVSEDSPLYHDIINGLENYLEDNRSSKMEFVFLKTKGIEPEIAYKGADGFVGMRNLEAILGVQGLRDGLESYERYKNASPMAKRAFNMWLDAAGNKQAHKELKEQLKKEPKLADVLKLNEDVSFAEFDSFTYNIFRKEQDAGKVDTYDTLGAAARYVDAHNLRGEFEAWLESLMEQAGAKEVFFAGYTRSGDRIYKDNTLENVSRHMRLQGRTNAYDDHGLSATKSALLQRLTSLSQIRKNKARLQNEAAYNKEYDALKDRLFNIISQLADMQEISSNQFMNIDYAESRLQEAITKRNPIAHLNKEYGYGIDPAGEYADEINSFIKDVQQMPAKYFETKFERPVYLNEFAAAVMPTTTSEDIKQAVSEAGLPIFEYDSEVEGSRREATLKATEGEGIRFRTARTADEFDTTQQEAVKEKGLVNSGLWSALINVVDVPKHDFTGTGNTAIRKAEQWALQNIAKEHVYHEGLNDEFRYLIDKDAVAKFLSKSSTQASENLGVHLAALKMLPQIIDNSIDVEIHPDYRKVDGSRSSENGVGRDDLLVHRMYGAISIDGKVYRTKTTIHEFRDKTNEAYDYKITEIELIISGPASGNALKSPTSVSAAKLLKGVEKSYDKGVKVLDVDYFRAIEAGDMETAQRMVNEAARLAGYDSNSDYQGSLAFNGAAPSGYAYYDTKEERIEAWESGEYEDDQTLGDYKDAGVDISNLGWSLTSPVAQRMGNEYTRESIKNLADAVNSDSRKIKVYRAVDADIKEDSVRNGDWVTPSRAYAEYHIGLQNWKEGRIIEQEVDIDDIWWDGNDINEWGYNDGKGYAYKNTQNNRKLLDPVTYDDNGNVIPLSERFSEEKSDIRFRTANNNQAIFVSNAAKAVEAIKQEKATPEQWLKMIEKNGGLKAGEDKWMGLSDWLKASDKKTLTKQEVLDFVNEHMIQIEEVHYEEPKKVREAIQEVEDEILERMQAEFDMYVEESQEQNDSIYMSDHYDYAYKKMWDIHGDDFTLAFELDYSGSLLEIKDTEAASHVSGIAIPENVEKINEIRLDYTTKGLTNNHEIALTVPTIESWTGGATNTLHFEDAGDGRAVAWIRFGDARTYSPQHKEFYDYQEQLKNKYYPERKVNSLSVSDLAVATREEKDEFLRLMQIKESVPFSSRMGRKVLVIDEIQSKRHQEGRERGYISKEKERELREKFEKAKERFFALDESLREKYGSDFANAESNDEYMEILSPEDYREYMSAQMDFSDARLEMNNPRYDAVPDAPFDKNWHELAMKRMLRYAAENGYDVVAWTKGDQQAERYNLGKIYNEIEREDNPNIEGRTFSFSGGNYDKVTVNEDGVVVDSTIEEAKGKPLSDLVGKDLAVKMMSLENYDTIDGEDLRIGGEGMKGFYDKMLPAFMNKYGRKWGVKVEDINLPGLENGLTMHSVPVTEEMKASVMEGQTMFKTRQPQEFAKQFMQDIVSDFYNTYGTAAPASVVYAKNRRMVEDALGFGKGEMPDWLYERVKEEAKDSGAYLLNMQFQNEDGTQENRRRILIFAKEGYRKSADIDRIIFHENTHGWILDKPELLELGKWLSGSDNKIIQQAVGWIKDAYETESWANEMLCDYVGNMLAIGKGQMALDLIPEEYKPLLNYIYEKFGYRPEQEDGRRDSELFEDIKALQVRDSELGGPGGDKTLFKTEISPEVRREMDVISAQAIVNGNYMKAPNGKNSKLTPEQWAMVRTQNFLNWAGDWINDSENASVVLDVETQEPLVLYHGTPRAGFTEFNSGWFTSSKEDAISYSGDRKGRLFDPNEKYEPETLTAGDFRLGYMTFDSEEDRAAFIAEHPTAEFAMSESEYENARIQAEDEEYDTLTERRPELQKIWDAYREYERDHFVDTTIGEILNNPDAYTEDDLRRAVLAYDSNAVFDSIDELETTEERKSALMDSLNYMNEDAKENGVEGILDMVVATRVPRNGEGVKHNDLGNRTYEVYARIERPYEIDANGRGSEFESGDIYQSVKDALADEQYDGVIIRNWRVGRHQQLGDVVVPKYGGNQVKLTTNENPSESGDIMFKTVTDPTKIAELEAGPNIKVYRAMQLIDGKLYPPMSAKIDGELRQPIELGQWEEAEERPDLVDDKGRFKLDKGNKTSVPARYNPYFHTSRTPLNDQFSSAQTRPNLVTVEVEIPESELTSGYKADKAKDSVGEKEWKAGVIQGKLSGTRKVILSRWDKPVRIVPDSEVAQKIVEMFDGKEITMPSNVVAPSLRAELEKLGVPFVETDNQGKKLTDISAMTTPIWSSKGTFANLAEAEKWADKNLKGRSKVNRYTGEKISIGANSISKMLSSKALKQSSSISAHLAALQSVLDFIETGIPAEIHADHEGRDFDVLRLYNAIEIDGKLYRVKSTVRKVRQGDKFYTYEVQEMELIEERWSSQKGEADNPRNPDSPINSITGAKLLKGVKKSNSEEDILPEKKNSVLDNTMDTGETSKGSKQNDTATLQDTVSDNKDSNNLANSNESGENLFKTTAEDYATMPVDELVEKGKMRISAENQLAADEFMNRIRAINGSLDQLRKAAAAQRKYDKSTVQILASLANDLLASGKIAEPSKGEVKRLISVLNNATGKRHLDKEVERLMDIMIANQLRHGRENFDKFLRIRGKKVDARGVEVKGRLDIPGQQIMDAIRDNIGLDLVDILFRMIEVEDNLTSETETIRRNAENEHIGLEFAKQYVETIKQSENEEKTLRKEVKEAEEEYEAGLRDRKSYTDFAKVAVKAIRENRTQRVLAYQKLIDDLAKVVTSSIQGAKLFNEAEKARVEKIQHFANSDMKGLPADAHKEAESKFWNNGLVRLFTSPLATFEQWLRVFGAKSPEGKGYLYNHFMGSWAKATDQMYLGMKAANATLDAKAREVFGDKVDRWSDLFAMEKELSKGRKYTISFWDDGEMKEYEVTQGNLLYIYMVNKMIDGKMKLRKMGITEENVDAIVNELDPRFITLADWIQGEFLPSIRDKYNAVHERLFGAPMAAIENYFPIKVLANARVREVDLGAAESSAKPSTITGSIIKRTKNGLALDVLHTDAFDLVLEHIEQMEQWAAFAEFNRDLNTLLSYKKFRNRVQNMSGVLGAGKEAWNSFRECAEIAAGVYQPKTAKADKLITNAVKGLTAGKISFRLWTAMKQILAMPAFIPYVSASEMAKAIATPWESWNWAMENLPAFEKRWKSREAGNVRLKATEADWKVWQSNAMEIATRLGMTPNAFVDAITCSIGSKAVYETQYARYIQDGYSREKADEKAKLDAMVVFNATQQSSESAFLSAVQSDRTFIAHVLTVFRNNSFGMQRELVDALRNIKKRSAAGFKEESIEFMKKQMVRDGLAEDDAERAAERVYKRSAFKDATRVATFGFLMQFLWNLGGSAVYLLFGDDDDEKRKMVKDAAIRGSFGSVEGLGFGNIITEGMAMAVTGDLKRFHPSLSPAGQDIESLWSELLSDPVAGVNELINILVQAGLGFNPQVITDFAVAIYDACDGDIETSKEIGLAILRMLQVPQSQIDKLKIDEIDFTKDRGLEMTIAEFAKEYAQYKKLRNAPLTHAAYSDEMKKKIDDKYIKRFLKDAEELKRSRGNEEAKKYYEYLDTEYKEVTNTINDLKRKSKEEAMKGNTIGPLEYAEMLRDYTESDIFQRYAQFGGKARAIERLRDKMMKVDSTTRGSIENTMLELRRQMVEEMESANY